MYCAVLCCTVVVAVVVVAFPHYSDIILFPYLLFMIEAFPSSSRDMVIKMAKKREEREREQAITGLKSNKNELSAEYSESHKLMIHWLNHTSRFTHTTTQTILPKSRCNVCRYP